MGAREPALGLRDRKKIRTRETIRSEAMRLIVANDLDKVTVDALTTQPADMPPPQGVSACARNHAGHGLGAGIGS